MERATAAEQRKLIDHMAVLSQYGRTMLSVQLFEVQLAMIAMIAGVGQSERPKRVPLHEEAAKTLRKMFHWLWRASAAEARNEAEKVLPSKFGPEIERAIKWRNRLAHRYPREQLFWSADGRFASGTYKELIDLTRAFDSLGKALHAELNRLVDELPRDENPPPEEVKEGLERAARDVFTGGRDVDPPPAGDQS